MKIGTLLRLGSFVGAVSLVVTSVALAQGMMGTGSHMMRGGMMGQGMGNGMMGSSSSLEKQSSGQHTATSSSAGTLQTGRSIYRANCASCHGANGAGGLHFGGAVSADLRAPELENMYHGSDKALEQAILAGTNADGERLSPAMPRFEGSLTETQVSDLLAYMKTLHG